MFALILDMFEPLDPLIKLNPQSVNLTVPSVQVTVNGMLIMNILFVKVPEKSKVSPAFSFPDIMFPLPLKYVEYLSSVNLTVDARISSSALAPRLFSTSTSLSTSSILPILSLMLPSFTLAITSPVFSSSSILEPSISFTAVSVAVKSILASLSPIIESESTSLALIDPIANINRINNPNIGINLLEFISFNTSIYKINHLAC